MRQLIILVMVVALSLAKPELYREKENFQYTPNSSDEGNKSEFYRAQRVKNMDTLTPRQMTALVSQVHGEQDDAAKAKTGNVFAASNSRSMYGSGDLSRTNVERARYHLHRRDLGAQTKQNWGNFKVEGNWAKKDTVRKETASNWNNARAGMSVRHRRDTEGQQEKRQVMKDLSEETHKNWKNYRAKGNWETAPALREETGKKWRDAREKYGEINHTHNHGHQHHHHHSDEDINRHHHDSDEDTHRHHHDRDENKHRHHHDNDGNNHRHHHDSDENNHHHHHGEDNHQHNHHSVEDTNHQPQSQQNRSENVDTHISTTTKTQE